VWGPSPTWEPVELAPVQLLDDRIVAAQHQWRERAGHASLVLGSIDDLGPVRIALDELVSGGEQSNACGCGVQPHLDPALAHTLQKREPAVGPCEIHLSETPSGELRTSGGPPSVAAGARVCA